jgi:glycerol-3-phosphate dehydrogenase
LRRDLARLQSGTFDAVIVGGGITGSCIARDAAMRGLKVALIEKRDFSWATSSATSKLVHGGLRYLKNYEFGLVRESLRERRIWQHLAPHLVSPLPFLIPQKRGQKDRLLLRLGLFLYDLLSFDRNWLDDPDQRMPGSRRIGREALAARAGFALDSHYDDALVYYDCQMYAPERLGLECIKQACLRGAAVANYVEADAITARGLDARDAMTGERFGIEARVVINAAGPWADVVMGRHAAPGPAHKLVRAKGIHLIVRGLTKGDALAAFTGAGHFFVLPWRGYTILGTTDDVFDGPPDRVTPDDADIEKMLALVNAGLPSLKLTRADVIHAYAGVRPLVEEGGGLSSYKRSRKASIIEHGAEGGPANLISALGGKWTTSRQLAKDTVDTMQRHLGVPRTRCQTHKIPLALRSVGNLAAFTARAQGEHKRAHPGVIANLVRNYGAAYEDVVAAASGDRTLLEPLSDRLDECGAQIVHAARSEMALTLEDAVFRRTGLGTLGHPGDAAIAKAAWLMAAEHGWSAQRQVEETDAVIARFRWGAATPAPAPAP